MKDSITQSNPNNRISRTLKAVLLPALFWLGAWQLVSMYVGRELLVASPGRVFAILLSEIQTSLFWRTIFTSILRITAGFLLAVALAVPAAMLTSRFEIPRMLLSPVISIVRATPVASFILFLLIWCKNTHVPSIITFLMVFPIVWTAVTKGIDTMDRDLIEVGRVFRLDSWHMLKDIYAPQVAPFFMQSVITSLGLAWKSGIAAEVLCTPNYSIGKMIYNARVYLETPQLFAWTLTVIALSMLLEALIVFLLGKLGYEKEDRT
ncbi:MAG: ABC transporter permease subunit [Oscillospiraceae bacterium]|nr:ABC transporter permease subunit [Oscillospiraceae bacterium]